MGKIIRTGMLVFTSAALLAACSDSGEQADTARPTERIKVLRSVVDQRPRMITLHLDDEFLAAWDARSGALYKAWSGELKLDGAVFTGAHGPQPTAEGMSWFVSPNMTPWSLQGETGAVVQYRGHGFNQDGGVTLRYELTDSDGDVTWIAETPQISRDSSGSLVFTRNFDVSGAGRPVLEVHMNSLAATGSFQTDGKYAAVKADGASGENGQLTLNRGRTTITMTMAEAPTVNHVLASENSGLPKGMQLMEGSDCMVCHNPTEQTVGPSFQAIAEKYANTDAVSASLAGRVIRGGGGVWGEAEMTPHPDLTFADAQIMIDHILSFDGEERAQAEMPAAPPDEEVEAAEETATFGSAPVEGSSMGVAVNVWQHREKLDAMPSPGADDKPAFSVVVPALHAMDDKAFEPLEYNFYMEGTGFISFPVDGTYVLRLVSDDGSILELDGEEIINNDGLHGTEAVDAQLDVAQGKQAFRLRYFQGEGGKAVSLQWLVPGQDSYTPIPPEYLSFDRADLRETEAVAVDWNSGVGKALPDGPAIPGHAGASLVAVHPSFDLETIRPESFEPKVAGLDVLPDGRVVVSTWDETGGVYIVSNVDQGDREKIQVKQIAEGLAEPLGLKVVDGDIYVLQKHELTRLVDEDGDEITDRYETVSNDWLVSSNFHEFAFGLSYREGQFWAALATAINPGGASTQPQIPDRGKVIRIDPDTGKTSFVAHGLRTPNGIGFGVDGELFIADNQGDWLPASKIVHVKEGAFYGSHSVDPEGTTGLPVQQPLVWLPQDEIGNSPSQPAPLDVGPYKGQMIHGEVTHGGLKRVFVEKVDGNYQGAVFRFSQGIEAGVNRIMWGADDKLYIGGIGNPGNWGHKGGLWHGLQRMSFNGQSTFEMLAVRARSNGMEIEFTEPVSEGQGDHASDWYVRQWRYVPTEAYGGPKIDDVKLEIASVTMSEDRRKVFLELPGMKAGSVVHVNIAAPLTSEGGQHLWTTEAWYTLNAVPADNAGVVGEQVVRPVYVNQLSPAEESEGFELLFDGKTTSGWHGFNDAEAPGAWHIQDGTLAFDKDAGSRGDIVTEGVYVDFELRLDWKISEAGNSGIFWHVQQEGFKRIWETGPEMQVLDNSRHRDGLIHMHQAGDLYDLVPSRFVSVRPVGQWNQVRIIVQEGRLEQWLNGYKVVDTSYQDDAWFDMISGSKFADMEGFGRFSSGHIALQDHDDKVWYRNIRIRPLD